MNTQSEPEKKEKNTFFQSAAPILDSNLPMDVSELPTISSQGDDSLRLRAPILSMDALNKILHERYRVEKELGHGGMGIVYRAVDLKLNRTVALKTILANASVSEEQIQRFRFEIKAAAMLQHKNIVSVHEVMEINGCPVCVMEFIEGVSLHEAVHKGMLDTKALVDIFIQLGVALGYAHSRGLMHRDIKPGNVMLTKEGVPKIMDFGLAKLLQKNESDTDSPQTIEGAILGTPSFMSPEQATGDPRQMSNSTDIYSLGATFYFTLTGRPPHDGENAIQVIQKVLSEPPTLPTTLNVHLPKDLEAICLKAMEKKPLLRYLTAPEFSEDLEHFREQKPISARRYDFKEKLFRAIALKKEMFTFSMFLVVLMFVGLVLSQGIHYRISRESLTDDLRERLKGIASTATLLVNAKDIEQIHTPADQNKEAFTRLVNSLKDVKRHNPKLEYVYLMRLSAQKNKAAQSTQNLEFIAEDDMLDSVEELDEDKNGLLDKQEAPPAIGEVYEETGKFPAMKHGLQTACADASVEVMDDYGVSLSGYAPIRDAEGNAVAVLGVDMKNDNVARIFQDIQHAFFWGVGFSIFLSLALFMFVLHWIIGLWRGKH